MKNINNVLKVFKSHGYEAYFVGGYPRDLYLGVDTIDYDITTNATPKEMMELFDIKSESYGCVKFTYDKIDLRQLLLDVILSMLITENLLKLNM